MYVVVFATVGSSELLGELQAAFVTFLMGHGEIVCWLPDVHRSVPFSMELPVVAMVTFHCSRVISSYRGNPIVNLPILYMFTVFCDNFTHLIHMYTHTYIYAHNAYTHVYTMHTHTCTHAQRINVHLFNFVLVWILS